MKVQRFDQNKQGKDYIVGDLHGCYEDFLQALKAIGFNETTDRVFSVGDLIDRGPYNKECIDLLERPWFHAAKGNHEDLMILSILEGKGESMRVWQSNGGHWIYKPSTWEPVYTDKQLKEMAQALNKLPLVIVVGEGENRYNIVHAEFLRFNGNVSDKDIDDWTFGLYDENSLIWGRSLIRQAPAVSPHNGLSLTFVGHTPIKQLVRCHQQIYLDLGCVYHYTSKQFDNQALAFACPQDKKVYSWSPAWKRIRTVDFADILDLLTVVNNAGSSV
jgi:serine/threonine protein phosphatase 1